VIRTLIAIVIPAMNFFLLATVGLDLAPTDFARVRHQPALLAVGLVAPVLLLPPLAVLLGRFLNPGPEIFASLLLVAACPIGGISNTFCIAAVVTIPLVGKGFELALSQPLGLSAPIPALVAQLVVVLGLPVAAGMWIRGRRPQLAQRLGPAVRRVAFIGTGVVLALVVLDAPGDFFGALSTTVPLAALFVGGSIVTGWLCGMLVTGDARDRFALAAEFGSRNVGVAIAIAVALLGRVAFARFAAIYALVEIPLMLGAIAIFRRRTAPSTLKAEPAASA
jgi:BASS family bile acid:Na+ symporter